MRRKDREITDAKQIEAFVAEEQILRVGFYDDGDIYIVPVNYGYSCEDGKYCFYFHGAKAGRKYELAKENPRVGFEIDGKYQLVKGDIACEHSAKFQSVIGAGRLRLLETKEEKIKGLNFVMKQVTQKAEWTFDEELLEQAGVFCIEVEKISCKAK